MEAISDKLSYDALKLRWKTEEGRRFAAQLLHAWSIKNPNWPKSLPNGYWAESVSELDDLRGITIYKEDLSNLDLSFTDLTAASFIECNLEKTSFQGALMTAVSFQGSNLDGADLSFCKGGEINFTGASLQETNFLHSSFPKPDSIFDALNLANIGLDQIPLQREAPMDPDADAECLVISWEIVKSRRPMQFNAFFSFNRAEGGETRYLYKEFGPSISDYKTPFSYEKAVEMLFSTEHLIQTISIPLESRERQEIMTKLMLSTDQVLIGDASTELTSIRRVVGLLKLVLRAMRKTKDPASKA